MTNSIKAPFISHRLIWGFLFEKLNKKYKIFFYRPSADLEHVFRKKINTFITHIDMLLKFLIKKFFMLKLTIKLLIPFSQSRCFFASFKHPKSFIWNNSSFRTPPFLVIHHVIFTVHKIWDFNLEQNFTLYTQKLVSIAKKDEHFVFL